MKILFTQDYKVQDVDGTEYKKGKTVDVSPESAAHFINKGVAQYPEKAKAEKEVKAK
ncbi:MAG: hypothetical protein JKY67_22615 [Pseudomonadales bacterium]|nr:hypothetical protein [Pseudomonadales bacterium]